MADAPLFCAHDEGFTMGADPGLRCAGCNVELVIVPKREWLLRNTPGESERELQRLLNTRTAALIRIKQYLMEVGIW